MATNGQENLETVLLDYLGAIRSGDQGAVRAVLDPEVTWQGLHEEWVCHGPDEVIETLQRGSGFAAMWRPLSSSAPVIGW